MARSLSCDKKNNKAPQAEKTTKNEYSQWFSLSLRIIVEYFKKWVLLDLQEVLSYLICY